MSTVLHIGLHKTATTYLQNAVFNRVRDPQLLVDPMPLSRYLGPLFFRLDYGLLQEAEIASFAHRLADERRRSGDRRWLISNETLGQNMYLLNYRAHADLLARLFPDAQIILMLRFQPDWFLSAYKQLMSRGDVQPLAAFLGYRDGVFHSCDRLEIAGRSLPHTNALELRYDEMIAALRASFGSDRVHVFFYEHFRRAPRTVLDRLGGILGTPLEPPARMPTVNRSFSARACWLSERRVALLRACGIATGHSGTRDAHRERQRGLERYLAGEPPPLEDLSGPRERRSAAEVIYWRFWMQKVLDRFAYRDWDLLNASGLRDLLTEHYTQINQRLVDLMDRETVPDLYTTKPSMIDATRPTVATQSGSLSTSESRACL